MKLEYKNDVVIFFLSARFEARHFFFFLSCYVICWSYIEYSSSAQRRHDSSRFLSSSFILLFSPSSFFFLLRSPVSFYSLPHAFDFLAAAICSIVSSHLHSFLFYDEPQPSFCVIGGKGEIYRYFFSLFIFILYFLLQWSRFSYGGIGGESRNKLDTFEPGSEIFAF